MMFCCSYIWSEILQNRIFGCTVARTSNSQIVATFIVYKNYHNNRCLLFRSSDDLVRSFLVNLFLILAKLNV